MKEYRELTKETARMLISLAWMYEQYCGSNYGHDFMSAGEDCIEILEDYGLGNEIKGINHKRLDSLEKYFRTLKAKETKQ